MRIRLSKSRLFHGPRQLLLRRLGTGTVARGSRDRSVDSRKSQLAELVHAITTGPVGSVGIGLATNGVGLVPPPLFLVGSLQGRCGSGGHHGIWWHGFWQFTPRMGEE
jgi:hypothetical protein